MTNHHDDLAAAKARIRVLEAELSQANARADRERKTNADLALAIHEARASKDALEAELAYVSGVNAQQADEMAKLRAEVHEHEDRWVRVRQLGEEMRAQLGLLAETCRIHRDSYAQGSRAVVEQLLDGYADILGAANADSDNFIVKHVNEASEAEVRELEKLAKMDKAVVTREMAEAYMQAGGVCSCDNGKFLVRARRGGGYEDMPVGSTQDFWVHTEALSPTPGFYTLMPIYPDDTQMPPEPVKTLTRGMSEADVKRLMQEQRDRRSAELERMARAMCPPATRLGVKLLRPGARMPEYAHEGDAGMDVFACLDGPIEIMPGKTAKVPTGVSFDTPNGYHIDCRGKSGHDSRGDFTVRLGLVDGTYRGELHVIVHAVYKGGYSADEGFAPKVPVVICPGDKIAQLVLQKTHHLPIVEVQELSETARGDKCFGSSGAR